MQNQLVYVLNFASSDGQVQHNWLENYLLSGNFRNDLILAISCFFRNLFQTQNIENAEIVSCIVFYKKLLKLQKMTDTN